MKNKKILVYLCSFILLLSFVTAVDLEIQCPSTATIGEIIGCELHLSEQVSSISYLQFNIDVPTGLSAQAVTDVPASDGFTVTYNAANDFVLISTPQIGMNPTYFGQIELEVMTADASLNLGLINFEIFDDMFSPITVNVLTSNTIVVAAAAPVDNDGDGHMSDVDCDDYEQAIGISLICGLDYDGDGYGDDNPALTSSTCLASGCQALDASDSDADDWELALDCDDTEISVNPGMTEVCGNGIDENCDGVDDVCVALPVDCDATDTNQDDFIYDSCLNENDCTDSGGAWYEYTCYIRDLIDFSAMGDGVDPGDATTFIAVLETRYGDEILADDADERYDITGDGWLNWDDVKLFIFLYNYEVGV
jgi:hypothetical protein